MPNTTNFNWSTPADTDLVKNGASAIRTLGSAIDTSFVDLKGGTTGQVLKKTSATDLDFEWGTASSGLTLINTTSFSGVSSQSINDVFSATYDNYRIHFANLTTTASDDIRLRWRVSSADNTTTNYRYAGRQTGTDASGSNVGAAGQTSARLGYFTSGQRNFLTGVDVSTPFLSCLTGTFNSAIDGSGATSYITTTTSFFNADTSFTGFTIFPASGNFTGSVSVYGYSK